MTRYVLVVDKREYAVNPGGTSIGRALNNHIVLSDPMVSSHHAVVIWGNHQMAIRDLASTNGTFVNRKPVDQEQLLYAGDVIQLGSTTLLLSTSTVPVARPAVSSWPTRIIVALVVLLGLLAILANLGNRLPISAQLTSPQRAAAVPTAGAQMAAFSTLERARLATVQVIGTTGSGSGSVVDQRGYILTNYHVVAHDPVLLIALNSPTLDAPPGPTYQAKAVASDSNLDLALLRIVADDVGRPLAGALDLVSLPIGDSDEIRLGDPIDILGFPDVGGATVTLTRGTVAGFVEDDEGHARGWIKTDAEISPGSSGGAAINLAGELIGVPSLVNTEERTLGRIGVLRPINLAQSVLLRIPRGGAI